LGPGAQPLGGQIHFRKPWMGCLGAFNPEGVAGCGHGWSAAQPVEGVIGLRTRPGRGGGVRRPCRGGARGVRGSTGFATLRAASLHPWLHPLAPLGPGAQPLGGQIHFRKPWMGCLGAFNPGGVAGCSHGWSAAQPVEVVIGLRTRPGRGGGLLRPCRGGMRGVLGSTGCAREARASPVATSLGPVGAGGRANPLLSTLDSSAPAAAADSSAPARASAGRLC
jgi:hypothetical protein